MSLFEKIAEGAIDCGSDFDTTLRRAYLLASRLGFEPFQSWVNSELNGYPDDAEVPQYRVVSTSISFEAVGPFDRRQSGIATWQFFEGNERIYESASEIHLRNSVAELISWAGTKDDIRVMPSPAVDFQVAMFVRKSHFELLSCRQVIAEAGVKRVLSSICTSLLRFVLEIEKLYPEAAERPLPQTPETERVVGIIYNQVFVQGGNPTFSMASGNAPVAIAASIEQRVAAAEKLTQFLRDEGLEVNKLAEVIEDATLEDIDQPESGVGQWIEKLPEAGKAAGKIVVVEAVKHVVGQILTGQFDPSVLPMIFG